MIAWAGRLIVFFGAAHTILALTLERALRYAGDWFTGSLWHDDLSAMSPANSALWLSVDSFGIPLVLVGLTILWLDRRGLTPPSFIAPVIGAWTALGALIMPLTPWPIMAVATGLLIAGSRRTARAQAPVGSS
ncbi:DUF6463 family protein [Nocardia sp. CDC153]|uniref:DUF6463 family protein n=1 Tax=Nocardia sp. CDC153 TaxID=3112167 RepID=UPI002DB56F5B|nr:DUF6463 family protein [Nocardia sp. CDC153]MEC3957730.1 DUF6463 family protein [Nocardia sp. CDC153]